MTLIRPQEIDISQYDYDLPDSRIASHPLAARDRCRLMVRTSDGKVSEHIFDTLPSLLPADSMLIYNNTRVINARLRFRKESGGLIEIFCLEPCSPSDYALNFAKCDRCSWHCLVGNSKRWKEGALTCRLKDDAGDETELRATRLSRTEGGESIVEFGWDNPSKSFSDIISMAGEIPIPPYLNRESEESDKEDYQTVYSRVEGSVAAPTAGLHFTDKVLSDISARGIERREVTLHVGAGTFRPVKSATVGEHEMHSEFISVECSLIEKLASYTGKVIAVGTTSVRTLESLYHIGCLVAEGKWDGELPQWYPYEESHPQLSVQGSLTALVDYLRAHGLERLVASTRIIIAPGYEYRIVGGMVTNFHQPQSTLLLLVSAFIGEQWREIYDRALSSGFRFLSYGDACLFLR